ncbi:MAG: hypothetical protein RML72_12805, partial [Bacteroidia bacterium]|nr:hypothetical protein [Bacteroidia bacterium]MDW8159738.1 hypothetical protein [Bacteroidia bacterium]
MSALLTALLGACTFAILALLSTSSASGQISSQRIKEVDIIEAPSSGRWLEPIDMGQAEKGSNKIFKPSVYRPSVQLNRLYWLKIYFPQGAAAMRLSLQHMPLHRVPIMGIFSDTSLAEPEISFSPQPGRGSILLRPMPPQGYFYVALGEQENRLDFSMYLFLQWEAEPLIRKNVLDPFLTNTTCANAACIVNGVKQSNANAPCNGGPNCGLTPPGGCWTITDNPLYYKFNVFDTPFDLSINPVSCSVIGEFIQVAIYQGCSSSPSYIGPAKCGGSAVSVLDDSKLTGTNITLNPGTYIMAIDGSSGAICDWTFTGDAQNPIKITGPVTVNCGQPLTLTASGGLTGATYSWQGPGIPTTNTQNLNINSVQPSNGGTYTLTVSIGGCTYTATHTVTVNPPPPPTVTSNSPVVCGQNVCFTTTLPTGFNATSYSWSGCTTPACSSTAQNPCFSGGPNLAGTYTLTVNYGGGCSATVHHTVTLLPPNTPVLSAAWTSCTQSQVCFTVTGVPPTPTPTYKFSGPPRPNWQVNWSPPAQANNVICRDTIVPGTYSVTVTLPNGCQTHATYVLGPPTFQKPTFTRPVLSSCTPATNCFNVNYPASCPNPSHEWHGPNGWFSTQINPCLNPVPQGTYTLVYYCGACRHDSVFSITPVEPHISYNVQPILCNSCLLLTGSGIPGATYVWTGPNGFSSTGAIAQRCPPSYLDIPGTYTVTATTSLGSCSNTFTVPTPIIPMPNITPVNNTCGSDMTFNITSSPNVPGGYSSYEWSGPNGFSSTLPNPVIETVSALNQGVYTLVVTLGECTTTKTQFIPILDMPPPFVAVSGNYCGQTLSFDLTPDNYDSYSWTGPCGFTSTLAEPSIPQIPVSCGGQYCLTVTKYSCVTSFCNTVSIDNLPPPDSYAPDFACTGETLVFSVNGVKPGNTYFWKKGSTIVGTQPNMVIPNPNTNMSGTYVLEMIEGPCTTSKSHVVNVFPTPLAPPFIKSNAPLCAGDTLKLEAGIVDGAEQYIWQGPAFNSPQSTPTEFKNVLNAQPSMSGIYDVKVTINGCPSHVKTVDVVIHPLPSAPNTSPTSRCGPGPVTLTAAMGVTPGDKIQVYTVATGGTPIATSTNTPPYIMTVNVTTTTTLYLESVVTSTGCRGPRTQVVVTVFPQPDPPTFTSPSRCGPGVITITAQMGTVAGTSMILYTQAGSQNGTTINPTPPGSNNYIIELPSISSNYTFYLQAALPHPQLPAPGCLSQLVPVPAAVHPLPQVPNIQNQTRCGNGSVTFTATLNDAIANQINLYTSANTSTAPIATDNSSPFHLEIDPVTTTTTFYATAINSATGCQSEPVPAVVNVVAPPAPPSAQPIDLCGASNANIFALMGSPGGEGIRLFTQSSGGTPIATQTNPPYLFTTYVTTTTTLYIDSYKTEMGLTCGSQRTSVPVTVHPIPGLPSAQNIEVCSPQRVTITAIMGNPAGQGILFYTPQSAVTPLYTQNTPPYEFTEVVTTTTTYHIQSYTAHCSSAKVPVVVTIHTPPAAPVANNLERCGPGIVTFTYPFNTLSPNIQILLYSSPYPGPALAVATSSNPVITIPTNITTTTTFYLEALNTITNCASSRTPLPVVIKPIPDPPVALNVLRCMGSNVPIVFTATMQGLSGTEVRFYTTPTGGTPVIDQSAPYEFVVGLPIPSTTTIYYLESVLDGCVSNRSSVQAIIIPNPGLPIANNVSRCGPGTVTITGQMGNPAGNVLRIFTEGCGGFPISTSEEGIMQVTVDIITTTTFYLQAFDSQTGCASNCSEVVATLHPLPPIPQSTGGSRCGCGNITFSATSSGVIRVFEAENALVPIASAQAPNSFTRNICTTTTYWLEAQNPFTNCVSPRSQVVLTVHPIPDPPKAQDVEICQPQSITLTFEPSTGATTVILYTQALGNSPILINSPYTYTVNIIESVTYQVTNVNPITSCESDPKAVRVTIKPVLTPPLAFVTSRCGPGIITITAVMQALPGSQVRFYNPVDVLVGTATTSPYTLVQNISTHTTFWVERFDPAAGCSSQKATVVASILPLPSPPAVNHIQICGPGSVTLRATPGPLIQRVRFSNIPYGGIESFTVSTIPFEYATTISTTTTYCVTAIDNNGCESPCQELVATVHPLPPSISVPPIHFCKGQTITFTVNHPQEISNLALYTSPTPGVGQPVQTSSSNLFTLANLTTDVDYFVEGVSSITGCTTQRAVARAILVPTPYPPSVQNVARCGVGDLTFTVINPDNNYHIRLLSANNNPIATQTTNPALFSVSINETTTYKVVNVDPVYGCQSEAATVVANIHPFPNPPVVQNMQRCGPGTVIFTIQVNQIGVGVRLFSQATSTAPIEALETPPYVWSPVEVGTTTTFFVEAYNLSTGCRSQRIPFRLEILPVPIAPQASALPLCNPGTTQFNFIVQGPVGNKIRLYTSPSSTSIEGEYDVGQTNITSPFIATTTTFY